jgi:diaminopimelate epimerase
MRRIPFWKMSGSGNDFVVVDNRRHLLKGNLAAWARRLCHRQFGVGADGLLLLEQNRSADFRMVYLNADGSRADMCGNGARCMAWFAEQKGVVRGHFKFQTDAYPVDATVAGSIVQVSLAGAKDFRPVVKVRVEGKMYRAAFLNTGVPHAVVFVPNVEKVDLLRIGRALRFHRAFGPRGANVNFVQKIGPDKLRVRTYERGVEGETLACGTGVTACAIAAVLQGRMKAPVRCVVTGGDTLEVRFQVRPGDLRKPVENVSLRGPVRLTFKGEFFADVIPRGR